MQLIKHSSVAIAFLFCFQMNLLADSLDSVISGDIDFTDIVENSNPADLFGQPTAANGNTLDFPGAGFNAVGIDGGLEFLDGVVELTASSNNGQSFTSVSLDEFGVYFNTGDSISEVDSFLTVIVNGEQYTDGFAFSFVGEGSGTWSGTATVTFPETLVAEIFIHNSLFANSVTDEVASINKRDIKLTVGQIPEPSIVGILLLGLVGFTSRRRR